MFFNAPNKQYDYVRQIAHLKQYERAIHFWITNEVTSLVLHIFLDQEIFFGSLFVLFTYTNRRPANLDNSA